MQTREEVEAAATGWIIQRESGSWGEAEATALAAWLDESPAHRAVYYRFNATWEATGRLKAMLGESARSSLARRLGVSSVRRLPRWLALAASTMIVALAAVFALHADLLGRNRYSTRVGGLETVRLSDGSQVILNTDSVIHVVMTNEERRIELPRGEAYFDVAKDSKRPFIVQVGSKRVVAVGTAFSVRRIGEDIQVAVAQGNVAISPASAPGQLDALPASELIRAGSVARAIGAEVRVRALPVADIEKSLSWRSGLLIFHNTPLAEAVAEFNRYNVKQIQIEDSRIAAMEVGGIFRSTNVEPFVQVLEHGFAVRAMVDGDRILLEGAN